MNLLQGKRLLDDRSEVQGISFPALKISHVKQPIEEPHRVSVDDSAASLNFEH